VLDAGIAVAVFAGLLGLLALGETDDDGGEVSLLEVLLAALASLPPVRMAPSAAARLRAGGARRPSEPAAHCVGA
jgi:hypothetical protein